MTDGGRFEATPSGTRMMIAGVPGKSGSDAGRFGSMGAKYWIGLDVAET